MGEDIVREITIEGPIEDVWETVTRHLGEWVGGDVEVDARAGAPIFVRWTDGSTSRGIVELAQPPTRFVFRWRRITESSLGVRFGEPTRVEFVLQHVAQRRTIVSVTESSAPVPRAPFSAGTRA